MKKIISALLLFMCAYAGPAFADSAADVKQEMDALAGKVLTEALQHIQKGGPIYPFAFLMDSKQEVKIVGYTGDVSVRPPADEFAGTLIKLILTKARENSSWKTAALAKMHTVQAEGQSIAGVWILVDHVDAPAWVVFQPLIRDDKPNHYSLGKQVYAPSDESLFLSK